MKKKILVTMLTVVMVMLLIPAMAMTASAADGDAFVIEGDAGYTYENGVLTITESGDYIVSMADGVAETDHTIVVSFDVTNVNLTLDGVVIKTTQGNAFEIKRGASVTLNGTATLQGAYYGIYKFGSGTLTVSGETTNVTAEGASSGIYNGSGTLTVSGGTLTAESAGDGIQNYGTLNIEGGKVEATGEGEYFRGISNSGELTIEGGTVNATATGYGGRGISNGNTLTIEGGTVNATATGQADAYGIYNTGSGKLTVSGETTNVTAEGGTGISNGGTLTIEGGTVEATATGSYDGIYNDGTLTVSGGKVTAESSGRNGIINFGTLNITGGEVTTEGNNIYNLGALTVSGGTLTAKGSVRGIYNENGGTLTITGGTVNATATSASGFGIENYGTLTVEGGTLTAEGGRYGIDNDGTIQAGEGKMLSITDESGNAVTLDQLKNYKKVTVTAVLPFMIKGNESGYTYKDGVLTFTQSGKYTVSMAPGLTETDHVIVVDGKDIILTLDGVVIKTTQNYAFEVKSGASVTLNTTDKGATLQSADRCIYNSGTLTISGGTVTATATGAGGYGGYGIYNWGALIISGGTVEAVATGDGGTGIFNFDTLIISGGTVEATATKGYSTGITNYTRGTLTISGGKVTTATGSNGIGIDNGGTIQAGEGKMLSITDESGNAVTLENLANYKKVTVTASYPLVVEGNESGYTYKDGVLTFKQSGDYTVSMVPGLTETDHVIVVGDGYSGINVNLTLDGVVIKTTQEYAFTVTYDTTVKLEGTATLQGAKFCIINHGTLTISGENTSVAAMNVYGGITNWGTLTISGGTVEAVATGSGNRGIYNEYTGTLNITGGTVTATATGANGYGIDNTGTLNISGGEVIAKGGKQALHGTPTLGGNIGSFVGDDDSNAKPGVYSNQKYLKYAPVEQGLVIIDNTTGKTPTTGYTYEDGVLFITAGGDYTISMAPGVMVTSDTIGIDANVTGVNLTLDGVNIDSKSYAALSVGRGASVTLSGTATLQDGTYGIDIQRSSTLTITGENTNVTAKGSVCGINNYGTLIIEGGTVDATATGRYFYGIRNGDTMTISGGTVTAIATGEGGTGIYNEYDGTLTISGGEVTAEGTADGAADGIFNMGTLTVSGDAAVTATGAGRGIITNNGTLIIEGGTIKAFGDQSAILGQASIPDGAAYTLLYREGATLAEAEGATESESYNSDSKAVIITAACKVTFNGGEGVFDDKTFYVEVGTKWDADTYAPMYNGAPITSATQFPGTDKAGWKVTGWTPSVENYTDEDGNLNANVTFTAVWKEKLTVEVDNTQQNFVYDGEAKDIVLNYLSDIGEQVEMNPIKITYYFVDPIGETSKPSTAGTYLVRITHEESMDVKAFEVEITMIIEKADLEIELTSPIPSVLPGNSIALNLKTNTDATPTWSITGGEHVSKTYIKIDDNLLIGRDNVQITVTYAETNNVKGGSKTITLEVGMADFSETIANLEADIDELNELLADKADADEIEQKLTEITNRLQALEDLKEAYIAADASLKSELETAIADAKTEITDAYIAAIEEAKNELHKAINDYEKEDARKLAEAVAELKAAIELAQTAAQNFATEADAALKQLLESAINEVQSYLASQISDLEDKLAEEVKKLQDQIDANDADIADINASITTINGLIDALKAADETLGSQITDAVEKAEKELAAAVSALEDKLAEEVKKLQDQIDANDADIDGINASITTINGLIDALKKADEALGRDISEAVTKAENELKAVQDELKELIGDVQTNLDNAKAELDKAIAALDAAMKKGDADLSAEIANLNTALAEAKAALEKADADNKAELVKKIEDADATLDAAIKAVQKNLDDAKAELNKAIADGDTALDEKITNLNAALESAKAALEATDAANKSELEGKITEAQTTLQSAIDKVAKDLADAKTALEKAISDGDSALSDRISALSTALDNAISAYKAADGALKSELTKKIEAADATLDAAIKAVQKNLDDAKAELNKAIADGDTELDGKITALNEALAAAKAALEAVDTASKSELTTKIDEAYASLDAAIKAVQKNLDDLKAQLEKADADNKAALEAKDAELQTFIIIVCVISCVALCGSGAFMVWFFIDRKKRI